MEKKAFVTKEQVEEIVKTYPTPFYLYDEAGIRRNVENVKKAFSWNPGFREYFAVKATPNPSIVKLLAEYDCGTDCASRTELMMAKALGLSGDHIMFSSNDTPFEEYTYANELGAIINLDDITHIDFCEEACGGKLPETMSCRYNPGGVYTLSNGIMDNPGDAKYGMTKAQMIEAYKTLMEKGVKHFGIHAFLASNTVTNEYYPKLAKELFELAIDLRNETGAHIAFINLSGGVGVAYKPDQTPNDILVIGEGVRGPGRHGRHRHLHRDGPLHAGALRRGRHEGHPREAHLQGVHRGRRLCRQPDASGDLRRVPSHHGPRERERPLRPRLRRHRLSLREQR